MLVGEAQATTFRVVVVRGLELADLTALADKGAVGLLVPGAGQKTSADLARAALVRGEVRNSLRDGMPEGWSSWLEEIRKHAEQKAKK